MIKCLHKKRLKYNQVKQETMETIENLATEKYINQRVLPPHKQLPANNFIDWAQFGAREAQRWISIDKELPEVNKRILVKDERIDAFTVGLLGSNKKFYTDNDQIVNITHWRPIERE